MNLLRFLLRSSLRTVIVATIAGAVAGATGIGLIALIQIELARESFAPATVVWAFAALCVISAIARVTGQIGMVRLGQRAVSDLSLQIVRRALKLPLRAFEAIDTSGMLSVLTEDIILIANASTGIPHLCINAPILIACLIYIGWLSPLIFVCGVCFAAPAIAISVLLSSMGVRKLRQARARQDALVGHFRTLIDGFRELKLHCGRREAYLAKSLEPTMACVRTDMVHGLTSFAVTEGWTQLAFFGFIGVLLFGIVRIEPIGRPMLVSAVLIVLYLMSPLDIILTWLPILGRARASLQKVQELIPMLEPLAEEVDDRLGRRTEFTLRDSVSLEGVTFTYRDERDRKGFTLEPVDLRLRRGEIVILAGGNGSGKTTLVKLVSGLYVPASGIVRVDGRVIDDANREAYRQLFSAVYTDGYLFPNVTGIGTESLERKARAGLERLGLAGQVSLGGSSFSTIDLSQGQRRRLALLGAWLEDRPILILDESAANQDLSFKRLFYYTLLPELRASGKALLIISHDESYFDVADRVIRIRDGRLVDEPPLAVCGDLACSFQ
jgi:putative pyoverdin transport system ATP-binding/permease protein